MSLSDLAALGSFVSGVRADLADLPRAPEETGQAHPADLDPAQPRRDEGLLDDAAFETVDAGARLLARRPGVRAAWTMTRANFTGRYLAFRAIPRVHG